MKRVAISFTSTLMAVYAGKLDVEMLEEMVVGCTADHLPSPGSPELPFEIAWCRKPGEPMVDIDYNRHLMSRDKLRPDQIAAYTRLWNRMCKIPVLYHRSSQRDIAAHYINKGYEVWMQYEWHIPDTFKDRGECYTPPVCLIPLKIGAL